MTATVLMAAGTGMLSALPSLTGLYVACLIIGGGLLVISTAFGGDHDSDVDVGGRVELGSHPDVELAGGATALDADADLDVGGMAADHAGGAVELHHADAGASPLSLSDWFSMRFVVYFTAVFGFMGTVLSYVTDLAASWTLAIAVGTGLVCGQGVHQAIRALGRSGGNSEVGPEDFLKKPARVTVAVRPPARGEVGVLVGNRELFLPAIAQRPDDAFATGDQVIITEYTGGMAVVVSRKEYEFVNPS